MEELKHVIPIGKENAIHQKELANILGVSPATAKEMVSKARKNGLEILSGRRGYYFPKDNRERQEFISMLSKQAITRLNTTKPIKISLETVKGQISLAEASESESKEV